MDPAPQSHPILSYVPSRHPLQSQATLRRRRVRSRRAHARPPPPLRARPDHELVDSSRALITAVAAGDSQIPEGDLEACRAVVRLGETHDAYEALLQEAEGRLERVYRSAMQGRDLEEAEGKEESLAAAGAEAGDATVQEEVVAVLKQAEEGKAVESVRLVDRQLRHLPEAFGRIQGLRVLDVSRNQLEVGYSDLIFPHHENEIAQSHATCCDSSINYGIHNGFVNVNSQKMSKSLGNFITIRKVIELYHPLALRMFLLGTHYRSLINYTIDQLNVASDRLYYTYQELLFTSSKVRFQMLIFMSSCSPAARFVNFL